MDWIFEEPSGVTFIQIPAFCPIQEYEAGLFDLFEKGFPPKVLIENLTGHTNWSLEDTKLHFERVKRYSSCLTTDHKVAIVAETHNNFAQGRMAQGQLTSILPCQIEVFRSKEEAIAWLCS